MRSILANRFTPPALPSQIPAVVSLTHPHLRSPVLT
jgi:hypothetical protein